MRARRSFSDAISKRNTEDLIHHSDQGIQYCSLDYVEVLKEYGIAIYPCQARPNHMTMPK